MIRLLVHGASGRLGQAIMRIAAASDQFDPRGAGRSDDKRRLADWSDVAIDVSAPEATLELLAVCQAAAKPLVVGTTGHSSTQIGELRAAAHELAIVLAPNFSVGVNLLFWLTAKTEKILGPEFDVEIVELHHRLKKDAPSGTAKRLAEIIGTGRKLDYEQQVRHGRHGLVGERSPKEIGMHAVRAGDIVGEHTVYFAGPGERVELVHRAASRDTFAQGAIRAARWVADQKPGLYDMQDVLGIR
jgi:4-hydroxy-tetrahydrodipicolinate reductase